MTARPVPRFSVVIPTHARPGPLDACLEGLARQTLPAGEFEVIVVDDGGALDAERLLAEWSDRLDLTVLTRARGGPGAARNLGAAHARGRDLAFIDDDCTPEPGWLAGLAASPLTSGALVGGPIRNALPGNPYAAAGQAIATFVYGYYAERQAGERFFTGNNLALPRAGFEALGGFDTSIPAATAEDKDLCDRWREGGGLLSEAPDARILHAHRLTLGRFWRQHYGYGRGILCFRILRRRREPARERPIRPEPWRFYGRLVLAPLRHPGGARGLRLSGLVLLAQIATAFGGAHAALFDVRRLPG